MLTMTVPRPRRRITDGHGLASQVADLSAQVSDLASDVAYIKGGIRVIGIGLGIGVALAAAMLTRGSW